MTPQHTATPPQATIHPVDPDLFEGGPPRRIERSLHLVKPADPGIMRRALIFMLVTWLPLAIFVVIRALVDPQSDVKGFFYDAANQVRYLVALPAFIIAERDCLPRLAGIVRHMYDLNLVQPADMPRFERALDSTKRLLHSKSVELLVVIGAYALVLALFYSFPENESRVWYRSQG